VSEDTPASLTTLVAVALTALTAVASGGCTASSTGQRSAVLKAEARMGVRSDLAACVANAALVELSTDELGQFLADPGTLSSSLNEKVTKLVADCAVEVASVPSTVPSTVPALTTVPGKT
jgi:hypothetical protein